MAIVNTTAGSSLMIRVSQWTAGPKSNINISFGDGTPVQALISVTASISQYIPHNYTISGTFLITAICIPTGLTGVSVTVNTITVNVKALPVYQGKLYAVFIFC
jgi:hypothetical protein